MKKLTKWIILVIILACSIQAVAAFSVSTVAIDPSGDLIPDTPVTVSFKIDFPASGGETFGSENTLQFFTDLDKAKWTYAIVLNGVENPRPSVGGRSLELSGFELSYPSSVEESVKVTLEGVAPSVISTINKTIIRIQELNSRNNVIESSKVEYTRMIINTEQIEAAIVEMGTNLDIFNKHIEENANLGIDTAAAKAKYDEAKQKIDNAKILPASQYTTKLDNLNAAKTSMDDGEKLLDKAWAEKEVADAQVTINNADSIIGWFKGNQSTANEPRLSPIEAQREIAASYISTANDAIASGNYDQARAKAQEAFAKGNESYTTALDLQKQVSGGFNPFAIFGNLFGSGVMVLVVGVVAVVLIIAGIIIYRKRTRWDELG